MKFTKFSKKLIAATVGAGALCVSAYSNAAFISNPDITTNNFGGFDWNSAANAVSTSATGFVNGASITTTYWATAIALKALAGPDLATPNMNGAPAGSYEYTVLATITETLTCAVAVGSPCGALTGTFIATGGSYRIWYDKTYDTGPTVKGNLVTGAGITDGTLIANGVIFPGFAGTFTPSSLTSGLGIFGFSGTANTTLAPLLFAGATGSNATSTLQLGSFTTSWTQATGVPGAGGSSLALPAGCGPAAIGPTCIIFQADGNQSFIPEPGTMALAGLGLLMAGWRRRKG